MVKIHKHLAMDDALYTIGSYGSWYASFWSPTNTQPAFSQYAIQQCVILVMRHFSYQQIRHLTVCTTVHLTPRANIQLKLLCPNTFITTFKI